MSKVQREILREIKEKGMLTIFDVDDVVWSFKQRGTEDYELFKALRMGLKSITEVRDINNVSSLYRMMESLVRRGLIGRVLHVRPAIWVYMENGLPSIKALKRSPKLIKLALKGKLEIRVKDEIQAFELPSP